MRTYLEELGVHPRVQHFFNPFLTQTCEEVIFKYGTSYEHASANFHKVPITEELWTAGEAGIATDIFICGSAMDAIAWLNLHHFKFRSFDHLLFIATGAVLNSNLLDAAPLQKNSPKKIHLLFSRDTLGAICDLKLASFIRNKPLKIHYQENLFNVSFENKNYEFDRLSLHALEKASGYNFRIRTHKPKNTPTYYEQLRNRHPA